MNSNTSHSRLNLLTGEWLLVSPHRTERPWQGQVEEIEAESDVQWDADCYLCPRNSRAGNNENPDYRGCFVFDNDFPALTAAPGPDGSDAMLQSRSETGRCRVLCYTERHDLRLATMSLADVSHALHALFTEFRQLDEQDGIGYVQMFENRGQMMGCSNMHPHAQIWATQHVPTEALKELEQQRRYLEKHGSPLLMDYLAKELTDGARVVFESTHFVVLVPYWATWPYETLILPRQTIDSPNDLDDAAVGSLAEALQAALRGCDGLFQTSTPYSLGFHPRPSDGKNSDGWVFHAHIYPPLLRSASVRKHMVGFEMLAMPQRDLTPELAAERLRDSLAKQ